MGKSKTTQTTNTSTNQTQTPTPWGPAIPGLTGLANLTNDAMLEVQNLPNYSGDFVALPGELQEQVIPALQASAQLASTLVNPALMASQTAMNELPVFGGPAIEAGTQSFGSYDPSGVDSVVQAAIQPYMRQLMEQVLPSLQSSSIESGAYGNDRAFAVMPQTAIRDTGRMASEVAAGIAFQDFLSQQQRQLEAFGLSTQRGLGEADVLTQRLSMYPELLDTAMRMSTGSADLFTEAAAYDTAMRQATINNALARDTYNAQVPFRGLDIASNIFGSFAPYASTNMSGTSNSTSTTTQKQPLGAQLFQGALGLGGMIAGFPGIGTALGIGNQVANPMINVNQNALQQAAASAFALPPFNPYQYYGG